MKNHENLPATMKNQPWIMKNHENPPETMNNQPEIIKKNHENPPGTMKNQPWIMKNHENPPGTMKNQPGTWRKHKNRPGTMKTHGYRWLQETPRRKWWFFITNRHTQIITIYISSTWTNPTKSGHLLVGLNHARAESHGAVARLIATFLVAARGRPANNHVLGVLLTGLSKRSKKYRRGNLECPFVT